MREDFVLDASARLYLLNGEPGAERLAEALPRSAVSAVNLSEVVSKLADAGGGPGSGRARVAGAAPEDRSLRRDAGEMGAGSLRPQTKRLGLSLGDRPCLALAKPLSASAPTAERVWADLADAVGAQVEVVRRR